MARSRSRKKKFELDRECVQSRTPILICPCVAQAPWLCYPEGRFIDLLTCVPERFALPKNVLKNSITDFQLLLDSITDAGPGRACKMSIAGKYDRNKKFV